MSNSLKKFLLDTGIGLVVAFILCCTMGLFTAESTVDILRILSDGYFLVGALLLAVGGLTFTSNEGAFDGLFYTFKTQINRMRRDYESRRQSFAQYREEREKKNKSPKESLLAGLVVISVGLIFMVACWQAGG